MAFESAECVGGFYYYPFSFRGDFTTRIYSINGLVHPGYYSTISTLQPMDTPANVGFNKFPQGVGPDPNAYYIGDNTPSNDGGLLNFTRQFANVPLPNEEPIGEQGFTFPAVPGGISESVTATSQTFDYNTTTFIVTISIALSPADFDRFQALEGTFLTVRNPSGWNYQLQGSGFIFNKKCFRGPAIITGVNEIEITEKWSYFQYGPGGGEKRFVNVVDAGTDNWLLENLIYPERSFAQALNSRAKRVSRYLLVDNPDSVFTEVRFNLYDDMRRQVFQTSDTTVPETTQSYKDLAIGGGFINANDESAQRWKGDIFEFSQIKVRAI